MTMILTLGLNALKHVEAKCPWIMICQVKTNENMSYALFFYTSKMILDGTKIFWTRPKKNIYLVHNFTLLTYVYNVLVPPKNILTSVMLIKLPV